MKRHLLIAAYIIGLSAQVLSQQQFVIKSENLTKADTIWVFTPNDYDELTNTAFPLIYLLHGWSGNYHQWDKIIDCQKFADEYGFIIVCPDGLYDSWYIDSPSQKENQFESFFMSDLSPTIWDNFRVQKQNIFITGLSMGGHGALYLFAKHPTYFKSAGSLSGLLDLNLWHNHYGIYRILGLEKTNNDEQILWEYSVAGNIDEINSANKNIIVSCGTEDPFYEINTTFIEACKKNNINVLFIESPGGHNSVYWSSAIDDHFEFFSRLMETTK